MFFVKNILNYSRFLILILPSIISFISLKKNLLYIFICKKKLVFFVNFLKLFFFGRFTNFVSINCVDCFNNVNRFELFYNFLSLKYNFRIFLKVSLSEFESVYSVSSIFKGSSWYEREIWDMFGVFFCFNFNLRRILTDYGFIGFPFRKDFPQSGFSELRYDDEKKYIVSESLELTQEFRSFNFSRSWLSLK